MALRVSLVWVWWALASSVAAEPLIAGWVEQVRLMEAGIDVHAKLDSGADHSSLNATDLFEFERDGRRWVRFSLRNREGEQVQIERPVVRIARIRRRADNTPNSGSGGEAFPAKRPGNTRPVIELTLCVGDLARRVEVNLADRGKFKYQLLIGRSFLKQGVLIDSASSYRAPPSCELSVHE
jgi:hypothetical protein